MQYLITPLLEGISIRDTYEIMSESIDVIKSDKEPVEEIIDEYGLDIDED